MSALQSSTASRRQLLEARARHMRFHPTYSEQLLWQAIRGKRLGVAFKRQVVIGNAIVDFLAPSLKLVVEIDGDIYHSKRPAADQARERKLVRSGYTVVRIPASLVEKRLASAVTVIQVALGAKLTP